MARASISAARLDRVILVPCARPPHKERPGLTNGFHRFAMAALAAADDPALAVSSEELRRGGVSYTVETLRAMQRELPGDELHLIVGSDSFLEMGSWKDHDEILSRAAVVVIPRTGSDPGRSRDGLPRTLSAALAEPGSPWPGSLRDALPFASVVDADPVAISSTEIRSQMKNGRSISGMVPPLVEAYVRRQGLYGPSPIG
jgi:nicotinate-nucleotide adenylyltransferase